ncbi:hypothetical protein AWW66_31555 [Micromonospora rosaria]|uniref:CBM2 domain-containing protein n=4 Tax=Micromonospora rosaria TaxID=47874 RepID=A0A136PIB4_9ACTN|nr:hypothetical protein AWW66_31555 [Micromonospora rosaria]
MAVYKITSTWNGGFQGEVEIMNHTSSTWAGWTATWALPQGQTIHSLWNGTSTISGQNVTVTNAAYNGALAPEGKTTFGFVAGNTGQGGLPTVTCTGR